MKKFFKIFGALIIVGIILAAGWFFVYPKYGSTILKFLKVQNDEASMYVKEIGKVVDLPADETPVVATVLDIEKLKGQAFFAKAVNGDKVLIYSKSKKAILYRPSTKKVLEMAPLLVDGTEQGALTETSDTSTTPESSSVVSDPTGVNIHQKVKVAIYNGTTQTGAAKLMEDKLKSVSEVEVVQTGNASNTTYKKTLVVNLTGGHEELVNKIIGVVGGEQGSMPTTEIKPVADVLVIYGN